MQLTNPKYFKYVKEFISGRLELLSVRVIASNFIQTCCIKCGNNKFQHWKYETNDEWRHLPEDLEVRRRTT